MPTKRKVKTPKFPGTVRRNPPITFTRSYKPASIRILEIWRLIALAKSNNAIAKELNISKSAVIQYITKLMKELNPPQETYPRVWLALEYMKRDIINNGLNQNATTL